LSQALYRRKAILTRIRKALDAFYLLQKIDWKYDVRATLERILGQALEEFEFEEGKQVERALIIIQAPDHGELEVPAGWKTEDTGLSFSRTVVRETMKSGQAILSEDATDDPRFMEAESIRGLEVLSLASVPLSFEGQSVGALYIESKASANPFNEGDLDFLREFTDTITPYLKAGLLHQGHLKTIKDLREQISDRYRFSNIIGRSESMKNVFDLVRIASQVDRTVLLTGESGSGKELIAHAIHYNGNRRERPFVVVDCSSLSEHLLESELFGHRRGAFTGASDDKTGAFEDADTGTIFLDEINDASKPLQQKLRRVLQEGEIRRVGENIVRKVNVRVICATNRNLLELVEASEFIRDLYFRINKFPIHVPSLRERREDIPLLVDHFLTLAAAQRERPTEQITPAALEILMRMDWAENNVRELRNTVELAVDLSNDEEIDNQVLNRVFNVQRGKPPSGPGPLPSSPAPDTGDDALIRLEKDRFRELLRLAGVNSEAIPKQQTPFYRIQLEVAARAIIEGLRASKWKLRPAAKLLGISPTKLRYELKEFLDQVLRQADGDLRRAASRSGIPEDVLRKKARDLGISQ
jgi:Nif-specific regulatory protein